MLNNVVDNLIKLAGGDVSAENASPLKSPPPPKFISTPAPYKPAPKKPAKVFKAGDTVELCPACGQEVKGIFTKGGNCPSCDYHFKKPIRVAINTLDKLPDDAFGKTSVMPSGAAVRLNRKKYGLPKKEGIMNTEDAQIEAAIDSMLEGAAGTIGHLALDLAGLIPGAEIFDFANMMWYLKEKKWLPAVLSLISVVPVVGDAIGKGGKLAPWLAKNLPKHSGKLAKWGPDLAAKIRKVEVAIKANSQIINQILNTAAEDPKIGKFVPQMKDALDGFTKGAISSEALLPPLEQAYRLLDTAYEDLEGMDKSQVIAYLLATIKDLTPEEAEQVADIAAGEEDVVSGMKRDKNEAEVDVEAMIDGQMKELSKETA